MDGTGPGLPSAPYYSSPAVGPPVAPFPSMQHSYGLAPHPQISHPPPNPLACGGSLSLAPSLPPANSSPASALPPALHGVNVLSEMSGIPAHLLANSGMQLAAQQLLAQRLLHRQLAANQVAAVPPRRQASSHPGSPDAACFSGSLPCLEKAWSGNWKADGDGGLYAPGLRPPEAHPGALLGLTLPAASPVVEAPASRGETQAQARLPDLAQRFAPSAGRAALATPAAASLSSRPPVPRPSRRVIWVKVGSYPWWPAKVLERGEASFPADARAPAPDALPVRYFGTWEFDWVADPGARLEWDEGYEHCRDECDQSSFLEALKEVDAFLHRGELPKVFLAKPKKRRRRASTAPAADEAAAHAPPPAPASAALQADAQGAPGAVAASRRLARCRELGLAPPAASPWAEPRIACNQELVAAVEASGAAAAAQNAVAV